MFSILEEANESELVMRMKEVIITHENVEEAFDKYRYGLLDTFDHCLSYEEADEILHSFEQHNLKYEHKFIEFMKLAFALNNDEPIIMSLPFHEIESAYVLYILNILDYSDRVAFIEQIRSLREPRIYHKIRHKEQLELYTKLATRELYFPIFYFTKSQMTLVGNFDLSFPLFCQDKDDLNKYTSIARQCGLFIREAVINE